MATTEAARNELYNRLVEVLGAESTETLMSSLPPVSTAELATKRDVASLEQGLADVNLKLERGLADVNRRIDRIFLAQIATLVALVAAVFAGRLPL